MWSLGCILAELYSGKVLFQNESVATLLARIVGIFALSLFVDFEWSSRFHPF